jgi:transposase
MYPHDFRRKVLAVREQEKWTIRETARRFCIGVATVTRWLRRIEVQRCKQRHRKIDKAALIQDIKDFPEAYPYERAARFGVCPKAIWQALKKLGVTYKKNTVPSQSGRPRTAHL